MSLLSLFSRSLGGTGYARSVQIVGLLIFRQRAEVALSSEPHVKVGHKEQTLYVSCLCEMEWFGSSRSPGTLNWAAGHLIGTVA